MSRASIFRVAALSTGLLVLAACGGGGGGSGGGGGGGGGPTSYTVGGSVSGLSGSGLVLQNSGGNNLSVSASGNFTFTTAVSGGGSYAVTVLAQPSSPAQTCTVSNGSGTVGSANVTNVAVACTTNTYTVGGSVSGLTGTGLVLQNNSGNNLPVAANGNFTFSTPVASGANYSVSVSTQPSGQTCAVTSGSGTVSSAAVSNVSVSCRAQVGKFLYIPNTGSNNISSYSIDATTGQLAALGTPVATGVAPAYASVDPTEKFLYIGNLGSTSSPPSISAYVVNSTTGALTQNVGSPFPLSVTAPPPNGVASLTPAVIDNATRFGYVSNRSDNKLYGARIDSSTGDLTEIAGLPMPFGQLLGFSTFDAAGKYLYVPYTETMTGYVSAFEVNGTSGSLTPIGGPVATGGSIPIFAQRHPSGKFLLVSNQAGIGATPPSVAVLSIDANSGALTTVAGSPFVVGAPAQIVSFHPTKNFIYALAAPPGLNRYLVIFQMDTTTGALTSTGAPNVTIGPGTGFPIVEPTGKFLIIPNSDSNNIQSFSIDQTTGALTEIAESPLATDLKPLPLRPDPSWKYFYGVNAGSNTVSAYSLNSTTGAMTLINSLPTGTTPGFVGLAGRQ